MSNKGSLSEFISKEKEKISKLDRHQKLIYFRDYYLLKIIIAVLLIIGICWFLHDVLNRNKTIYTGAGVGVNLSQAGEKMVTDDFLAFLGNGYKNKVVKYGGNTLMDPQNGSDVNSYNLTMAFLSQVNSGMFQYFLMTEDHFEEYMQYDIYLDLSDVKEDPRYKDIEYLNDAQGHPAAMKLSDTTRQKLGITSEEAYIAFAYSEKQNELNNRMIEYLFS